MKVQFLKIFLLANLFLIPLLGTYQGLGYEKTKILFFILSTSLIGFIWLFQKPQIKWSSIKIASLVFILILFITSALGIDFKLSLLGQEPYFQGLILYAYLFLFSLLVSAAAVKLDQAALALAGSATIVSLVAIQDWGLLNIFGQQVPTYAGRVVSTFGQPNFYAGFLLLSLPFSYYLIVIARNEVTKQSSKIDRHVVPQSGTPRDDKLVWILGWGSGLISVLGVFVSYSRSAILMALMLMVLGLIDQLKDKVRIGVVVFAVVLTSIIIALMVGSGVVGNEISLPILTKNPDLTRESVEKRAYIWPVVLKIALQKPLTGYGLENIGKSFSDYFMTNFHLLFEENLKISPVLISLKELAIDRSHNYLLDLLLFSGVFGLLGWLGLIGVLFIKLYQNVHHPKQNVLFVSLLTYLVWVQFQNQSIVHLLYFWLLAGIIDKDKS